MLLSPHVDGVGGCAVGAARAAPDLLPGSRHVLRVRRARARSRRWRASRSSSAASRAARGVVTAASYEVRRLGVKSGMSLIEAGKLAPDAIYLPTRGDTYGDYAERVRDIARRYSPVVLVASIDEMFLDFIRLRAPLRAAGRRERRRRHRTRGPRAAPATIDASSACPRAPGIATSKVMAKVASSLAKPRGVMLVPAGVERAVLAPLPVRSFPGIGPVAESKLHAAGYQTLGAIAEAPLADAARDLRRLGGLDPAGRAGTRRRDRSAASARRSPSTIPRARRSAASPTSARSARTSRDPATIESVLCGLCERVCWRARKRRIKARTVTLKLRYADFHTLTRSRTLAPTHSELELYPDRSRRCWPRRARVRCRCACSACSCRTWACSSSCRCSTTTNGSGAVVDDIRETLRLLDGRPGHAARWRRQDAGRPPLRRPRRLTPLDDVTEHFAVHLVA